MLRLQCPLRYMRANLCSHEIQDLSRCKLRLSQRRLKLPSAKIPIPNATYLIPRKITLTLHADQLRRLLSHSAVHLHISTTVCSKVMPKHPSEEMSSVCLHLLIPSGIQNQLTSNTCQSHGQNHASDIDGRRVEYGERGGVDGCCARSKVHPAHRSGRP